MTKLMCEHGRRVMVTQQRVIHRSDSSGCDSEIPLKIGGRWVWPIVLRRRMWGGIR